MKKEAVNMRPTATMTTASVGYQSTGTGLEIAFAAISPDLRASAPPLFVSAAAICGDSRAAVDGGGRLLGPLLGRC